MTDTLLSPEDTGEIRLRDPGTTTTNLMFVLNPPALRRPDATFEIPVIEGGCRTVVPNDDDFEPSRPIPHPDPLPPPPPPTPQVDDRPLSDGEEIAWTQATLAEAMGVRLKKRSVMYVMPAERHPGPRGRHRRQAPGPVRRAVSAFLDAMFGTN